jgi:hypothetical protein
VTPSLEYEYRSSEYEYEKRGIPNETHHAGGARDCDLTPSAAAASHACDG